VLEPRRSGVGLVEVGAIVMVSVVAVVVAFWLLSAIAGIVWFLVKLAVVILVVAFVVRLLVGRR
jgi:hypothetical protein